jgi:hypothetical protein
MGTPDQALATQPKNSEAGTGRSLDERTALVQRSGLTQFGELGQMLMRELGPGYGDANTLVHYALETDGSSAAADWSPDELLDGIYAGPKGPLRPIHDALVRHRRRPDRQALTRGTAYGANESPRVTIVSPSTLAWARRRRSNGSPW